MVEQSAVNRSVVGSNPTCGAIFMESCPSWSKEHDWKSCRPLPRSQGFKSLALRQHSFFWPVGQVVKTPPFHGGNTGSNPVRVIFSKISSERRISSAGRALALQARGRRFESCILHHVLFYEFSRKIHLFIIFLKLIFALFIGWSASMGIKKK